MTRGLGAVFAAVLMLAGCAGPPLTIYTLALPPSTGPDTPLGKKPWVIAISRVTLPNDVDGSDILVRDGSVLRRSMTGRWGSRLSVGVTARLADRLAARFPQALVTVTPLTDTPNVSIRININRLDIEADGTGVLDADWMVVAANSHIPVRQQRVRITQQGSVTTDADIVNLLGALIDALAADIDPGTLR